MAYYDDSTEFIRAANIIDNFSRDGYVLKLSSAANTLKEMEFLLSNFSNSLKSYEVNELISSLRSLKLEEIDFNTLRNLGIVFSDENISIFKQLVNLLQGPMPFKAEDLENFIAVSNNLSNKINALGDYINNLAFLLNKQEEYSKNIKIQNLINLINNDELINNLGLDKKQLEEQLKIELRNSGLTVDLYNNNAADLYNNTTNLSDYEIIGPDGEPVNIFDTVKVKVKRRKK